MSWKLALVASIVLLSLSAEAARDTKQILPRSWQFEPTWREKGDCGPASLYVLMRLMGRNVSLADVKGVIRINPETGCSLADIAAGADALGVTAEIRFLKPQDISRLTFPCILHVNGSLKTGAGHFFVVAAYYPDKHELAVVDTDFDMLRPLSEREFFQDFSGYALLAKDANAGWSRNVAVYLIGVGSFLALLSLFGIRERLGRKRASSRSTATGEPV
jgi:ABC-type bacteriocin/lantibiotic exporter with double-glycine peptidase domain